MAEGTIKKLTEKGFGFIDTGEDKDLFFHHSSLEGVSFDDLREGQRVTFTEGLIVPHKSAAGSACGGIAATAGSLDFGGSVANDCLLVIRGTA